MLTRTWPYGTTIKATVLKEEQVNGLQLLVLEDEKGEGHVLIGTRSQGSPGDRGVLTFTSGGPTGGYWVFTKEG